MNIKFFILVALLGLTSCGQNDTSSSSDGISSNEHRVFITSNQFKGNFGSIAQADSICAAAASSAGLKLSYKAILSDSLTNAIDHTPLAGGVYTFDAAGLKLLVADSGADLWDNDNTSFSNPINKDEFGSTISSANVWTGSNGTGYRDVGNAFCSDWASASSSLNGRFGDVGQTNLSEWINKGALSCDSDAHLYCISL